MKFGIKSVLASLTLAIGGAALPAHAAGVPVTVDITSLRAIQKYTLDEKADDQAYILVTGISGDKPLDARFPETGKTWEAAPKKPAVTEKEPVTVWKGALDDGEFALVTVSLFQGTGKDETLTKKYAEQIAAAEKSAPGFDKKKLAAADVKPLAQAVVKNEQAVITKIKDTFSRQKNTDHFGGLFNVLVWNEGGKIKKRVDPVGLTFGEHFGNDEKVYTKIKFTRNNVFVQDDKGVWGAERMEPLSDDEKTLRVKMLENELIKKPGSNPTPKTTDYLAGVQVTADGKALKWKLPPEGPDGQVVGVDDIHTYWNYAN
ncbi:MAG: hypothetical protein JWL69_4749 [Phycisphaerales bacterium]|nr:hypothetical protein [Phycisphaerales bacterium]MDB5355590.1 hypothetical protein [Phycisphaerales bacterium]